MKRFVRAIVQNGQGQFLTVHHLEGACNFPGGKVEEGEAPEEACRREVQEEVGITLGLLKLCHHGLFPVGTDVWEGWYFSAESYSGIPANYEPQKIAKTAFHSADYLRIHGSALFVGTVLETLTRQ